MNRVTTNKDLMNRVTTNKDLMNRVATNKDLMNRVTTNEDPMNRVTTNKKQPDLQLQVRLNWQRLCKKKLGKEVYFWAI